jgi:hypothetical protein
MLRANILAGDSPMHEQTSTPDNTSFSIVKHGWFIALVAFAIFKSYGDITGLRTGIPATGYAVIGAALAGHYLFHKRPGLSLAEQYIALAGVTALLALPVMIAQQMMR